MNLIGAQPHWVTNKATKIDVHPTPMPHAAPKYGVLLNFFWATYILDNLQIRHWDFNRIPNPYTNERWPRGS